ncbi:MAG: hypothetical protein H6627_14830 [Calditrichae bacterium]|nr:hypothetical protein [Calditrichota bacterium]MCB9059839.1 hypothetical protein [Calditrichia bacterium]
MVDPMIAYFKAEKAGSVLIILAALIGGFISVYMFMKLKENFLTGLSIPLFSIALIQLIVGSSVFFRTDKQVANLANTYSESIKNFVDKEKPRMEKVLSSFRIYKWIEAAFIIAGLLLLLFTSDKNLWAGIGLGLLLQGSLMLAFDIFAERRAEIYMSWINSITGG